MKKALIYVKEIEGRTVGQVAMVMDAGEMDKWSHHHVNNGFAIKAEIPAAIEDVPTELLHGVKVPPQVESWTDGTSTVYQQPVDMTGWTYQPASPEHWEIQTSAAYVSYDKSKRVGNKFKLLNDEVEVEMKQVYQTSNPNSAVANYLTWMAMVRNPSKFSNKGLIARFEVVGLTIGAALDTDKKVSDYATALIDIADDYAIWREQKIIQFMTEKTAIEAE